MITFHGIYFDGTRSRAHPVTVMYDAGIVRVHADTQDVARHEPLSALTITPPLGQARRALQFPDGARCETDDLAAIAALDTLRGSTWSIRLVHGLESHWRLVGACVIGLVLCVWLFTVHGIPWIANYAAFATPQHLLSGVSERSLVLLDRTLFEPSTLSTERAAHLQEQFTQLTNDIGTHSDYRLVLRHSPQIGANALALPSGLIIMTDALVTLADEEREILGVLAHEVAHVEQRHGLRNMYQSVGIFLLLAILAGDVTSINATAGSIPTLLIEMGYSRQFEREADAYAAAYMLAQGWGTAPLQNILRRLTGDDPSMFPAFLTTHPGTKERLEHLQTLQREWSEAH